MSLVPYKTYFVPYKTVWKDVFSDNHELLCLFRLIMFRVRNIFPLKYDNFFRRKNIAEVRITQMGTIMWNTRPKECVIWTRMRWPEVTQAHSLQFHLKLRKNLSILAVKYPYNCLPGLKLGKHFFRYSKLLLGWGIIINIF